MFWSLLPPLALLLSFLGHPALPPPRGGSASRVSPQSCQSSHIHDKFQLTHQWALSHISMGHTCSHDFSMLRHDSCHACDSFHTVTHVTHVIHFNRSCHTYQWHVWHKLFEYMCIHVYACICIYIYESCVEKERHICQWKKGVLGTHIMHMCDSNYWPIGIGNVSYIAFKVLCHTLAMCHTSLLR